MIAASIFEDWNTAIGALIGEEFDIKVIIYISKDGAFLILAIIIVYFKVFNVEDGKDSIKKI